MMSNQEFIDGIWEKYNRYNDFENKDRFFKKHLLKNKEYIRTVKTFLSLIIAFVTTIGVSYAGTIVYKEITQRNSQIITPNSMNYSEFFEDFNLEDKRFYKKIYTYEEYLSIKNHFSNIVEMSKEDFKDNFMIVIAFESFEDAGTYINEIISTEDTIYIELAKYKENEIFDINNNAISSVIPKDDDRENIKIELVYDKDLKPDSSNFKNITEISNDYNIKQAIEDGCFVVDNFEILSEDRNQLETFIENTKNGKNDFIRIVTFTNYNNSENPIISIKDIEYRNSKYLIAGIIIDENKTKSEISYLIGKEILVQKTKTDEDGPWKQIRYSITLENQLEENKKAVICNINL